MGITTRRAVIEDLEQMLTVEQAAISLRYLKEMAADFFADNDGEMTVALVDGIIAGFGKLTFQYDGSAWAELLRVEPKYQGMGVGGAIWRRYMEQVEKKNPPAMRMYTGTGNVVSSHLAAKNGLATKITATEGTLELSEDYAQVNDFECVGYETLAEKLRQAEREWGQYACFNRTFYKMGKPFYCGMADEHKLYSDGKNIVAFGARFMPERGMHIGFLSGDAKKCIDFAKGECTKIGAKKLICMCPNTNLEVLNNLIDAGFVFGQSDLLMLEREF